MMKKRIAALLLALTCCAGTFAACGESGNNSGTSGSQSSASTEGELYKDVTDADKHLVSEEKLLHRVKVTEVNRPFVVNGNSDYIIVVGKKNDAAEKAAQFLANQVGAATGAYLSVELEAESEKSNLTWTADKKYIAIDCENMENTAKVTWHNETEDIDLGYSGYMMRTVGNTVFMKVNSDYGYQMVVLSFLREVLGYEWFGDDTISYSKSGATLPDLDIVEKPDFDLSFSSSLWTSASKYASGLSDVNVFVSPEGQYVHNSYIYLPPETYAEEHPDWYSNEWATYHDGWRPGQLCYTAHGNKAEYDLMLQTAVTSMLKYLANEPECCTITFTQQDTQAVCPCETCMAAANEFTAVSSTLVMFVNDLEDSLRAELEKIAEENNTEPREITVLFFAYQKTVYAPVAGSSAENYQLEVNADNKVTAADGTVYELPYHKTYPNGIVCNENVGCYYAPIGARYNQSLYADSTASTGARVELEKWGKLTSHIYVWTYDTNFTHYLFPYNSYENIVDTARCLKENNTDLYFAQTQDWRNGSIPCFGALKRYIVSAVRYNVNMNYEEAVDKFFANYFQDAAEPMRKYFDKLTAYLEYLEMAYPSTFTGSIYDSFVNESKYWSFALMNDYLSLCDEAYAAIEKYKTSDPEKYELLAKHINLETIFPRFVICDYYGGMYATSEIQAMRQAFCTDCKALGINKYGENDAYLMTVYYDKWGVD